MGEASPEGQVARRSQAAAARQGQAPVRAAAGSETGAESSSSRKHSDVYPKRYKGRSPGPWPRRVDDLPLPQVRAHSAAPERRPLHVVLLPEVRHAHARRALHIGGKLTDPGNRR